MSDIDTKVGLSAATLLNAIQLPVVIADLVLGEVTKEELLEGSTVKYVCTPESVDINEPDSLPVSQGELAERRDVVGAHQLSANQVARAVITKLKFK